MLLGLFANKLGFWRSREIEDLLDKCLEVGANQDTGSCMPPTLKMPYHNGKVQYLLQICYMILPWWKLKRYALQGGLFCIL